MIQTVTVSRIRRNPRMGGDRAVCRMIHLMCKVVAIAVFVWNLVPSHTVCIAFVVVPGALWGLSYGCGVSLTGVASVFSFAHKSFEPGQ